jgi:hypothetical protein
VAVVNNKGGVGKTTVTANLGAGLAARGYTVLMVDLDPQASLTKSFFTVDEAVEFRIRQQTIGAWFARASAGGPSCWPTSRSDRNGSTACSRTAARSRWCRPTRRSSTPRA